jgi:hypothetical protein
MAELLFTYGPLGLSALAFFVSAFSLGWNIYRDVVMKPTLRVQFGVSQLLNEDGPLGPPLLTLSATNYGPGQVTCEMASIKRSSILRWLTRRIVRANVVQDYKHPMCWKLPHRLNMAEHLQLVFGYDAKCFIRTLPTHVGIYDSFGRVHWAPRRQVKEAIARYKKDFGSPTREDQKVAL